MRLDAPVLQRLLGSAALITPLLAVQVAQLLAGWGPAPASAGERAPEPVLPALQIAAGKSLNAAQQRAADFLLAERVVPAPTAREPSPMYEIPRASNQPRPTPTPTSTAGQETGPKLVLTGIMAGETRQLASINNRIVSVGDEVASGWRISDIDVAGRTVTVIDQAGRTLTLTPSAQKPR